MKYICQCDTGRQGSRGFRVTDDSYIIGTIPPATDPCDLEFDTLEELHQHLHEIHRKDKSI